MLAVVTVLAVAAAVLHLRFRGVAAAPGLAAGAFLVFMAFAAPDLWNWSREYNGAGLPDRYTALTGTDSLSFRAFASAALGSLLGGCLASWAVGTTGERVSKGDLEFDPRYADLLNLGSLAMFAAWILGQGPSFLMRTEYLGVDGIPALLTATNTPGPVLALGVFLAVGLGSRNRHVLLTSVLVGSIWGISLVAVGTRVGMAFPVAAGLILITWCVRARPAWLPAVVPVVVYTSIYCSIAVFAHSLFVRTNVVHGLIPLLEGSTSSAFEAFDDPSTWSESVQRLTSSVTASSVIVEYSARFHPGAEIVILNANPLPTSLATGADPITYERMLPYEWVPLALVGELYGALGMVVQILVYGTASFASGVAMALCRRRGDILGMTLMFVLALLFAVMSAQYSSRMAWRISSLVLAVSIGISALPLLRPAILHITKGTVLARVIGGGE